MNFPNSATFAYQISTVKLFRPGLVVLLLITAQITYAQTSEKWTLEKCIAYALENNIAVRQSGLSSQVSGNQHLQSKLNLLPSVDANAGYNVSYGNSLNPITYSFQQVNSQSLQGSIQGNFTIFNGLQQVFNIEKTKYDLLAARFDYENAKNNLALNVASSYLQILLNREILQVAEKQHELTRSQKDVTDSKIKAGMLSEYAIYEVDAQLSRDEANVVSAKGTLDISVLSLKQLLQLSADQRFELDVPEISTDSLEGVANLSSGIIYNFALSAQPSIKSAEAKLKSADASRKIAIGYITPTITSYFTLSSGYQTSILDNTGFSDQLTNNFRKALGISLNVPLFGKGQRFLNISSAKIQQHISQLELENTKNRLRQDIEQAYANATAAAETFNANSKSYESANKSFTALEKRFKAGLTTTFDLQQSKNTVAAAESEMIKAKYTYVFRLKVLDFYQGKPITLNNK